MFIQLTKRRDLSDCGRSAAGREFYRRGVVSSTSTTEMDLVTAHTYFNLAAREGEPRAAAARASVALDMTSREVTEAQRRARAILG